MPLIIDSLTISRHARQRMKERGVPSPQEVRLRRLNGEEAKRVRTYAKKKKGMTIQARHLNAGFFVTTGEAKCDCVYLLAPSDRRSYVVVTCWHVPGLIASVPGKTNARKIVEEEAWRVYRIAPEYKVHELKEGYQCQLTHPDGTVAVGIGKSKNAARRAAAENYLDANP